MGIQFSLLKEKVLFKFNFKSYISRNTRVIHECFIVKKCKNPLWSEAFWTPFDLSLPSTLVTVSTCKHCLGLPEILMHCFPYISPFLLVEAVLLHRSSHRLGGTLSAPLSTGTWLPNPELLPLPRLPRAGVQPQDMRSGPLDLIR